MKALFKTMVFTVLFGLFVSTSQSQAIEVDVPVVPVAQIALTAGVFGYFAYKQDWTARTWWDNVKNAGKIAFLGGVAYALYPRFIQGCDGLIEAYSA